MGSALPAVVQRVMHARGFADAAAVAAVAHALVVELAERHDAGELPPPAPSWRIAENRWSASRPGAPG